MLGLSSYLLCLSGEHVYCVGKTVYRRIYSELLFPTLVSDPLMAEPCLPLAYRLPTFCPDFTSDTSQPLLSPPVIDPGIAGVEMDFLLRCNSLKCRAQLKDRAVVTTCSHIFCVSCSESLGLALPNSHARQCPACGTGLTNPDDVVVTQLNPTEDYKTSVLSGLSPSIIMECAGRGLLFHSYQTTQEM